MLMTSLPTCRDYNSTHALVWNVAGTRTIVVYVHVHRLMVDQRIRCLC